MKKVCLVTVGSTKFDELIVEVLKPPTIRRLKELGIQELIIQSGAGEVFEDCRERANDNIREGLQEEDEVFGPNERLEWREFDLNITMIRYVNNLQPLIQKANIVIAHGGAGTIFEVMNAKKTMFVVINRALMSDHQTELAQELAKSKDLHFVSQSSELLSALNKENINIIPTVLPPNKEERRKFVEDLFQRCEFIL